MIVERWTFTVKIGCRDEFIEMTRAFTEEIGQTPRICTYLWGSGPYDVVWYEVEYETMEDRDKFWAGVDWNGPAMTEFHKKAVDLMVSPRIGELIQVH